MIPDKPYVNMTKRPHESDVFQMRQGRYIEYSIWSSIRRERLSLPIVEIGTPLHDILPPKTSEKELSVVPRCEVHKHIIQIDYKIPVTGVLKIMLKKMDNPPTIPYTFVMILN